MTKVWNKDGSVYRNVEVERVQGINWRCVVYNSSGKELHVCCLADYWQCHQVKKMILSNLRKDIEQGRVDG